MRNLKKFLALVLAMMMVMGLMVTVNAATSEDAVDRGQVKPAYKEALDVMVALDIVSGKNANAGVLEIAPNDTFTRGEFATMLYKIVGGGSELEKVAKDLYKNDQIFDDVKPGEWYTEFVNYAAKRELISGRGNGIYAPNDDVAVTDVLVVMLKILGIKADTSKDYTLGVITAGVNAKLTAGFASDDALTGKATRQMAAQILFNAMTISPSGAVEYVVTKADGTTEAYRGPDRDLALIAMASNPGATIDTSAVPTDSLLAKNFNVTKNTGSKDAFGRYTTEYKKGNDVLYSLVNTPAASFSSNFTAADAKAYDGKTMTVYYNGEVDAANYKFEEDGKSAANGLWLAAGSIPGYEIDIYATGTNTYDVIVREAYLGKVGKAAANGSIPLTVYEYNKTGGVTYTIPTTASIYSAVAAHSENDYVAVYVKNGGLDAASPAVADILEVANLVVVDSKVTGITKGAKNCLSTITAGGANYRVSNEALRTADGATFASNIMGISGAQQVQLGDLRLWLHKGNVLLVDSKPVSTSAPDTVNSVYVVYKWTSGWNEFGDPTVYSFQGVLPDGTSVVGQLANNATTTLKVDNVTAGVGYQYTVTDGKYLLTAGTGSATAIGIGAATAGTQISANAPRLGTSGAYFADNVKFINVSGSGATLKVDVRSGVQALTTAATDYIVYSKVNNSVVITAYITGTAFSNTQAATDLIYIPTAITAAAGQAYAPDGVTVLNQVWVYLNGVRTLITVPSGDNWAATLDAGWHTYSVNTTTGAYNVAAATTPAGTGHGVQVSSIGTNGTKYYLNTQNGTPATALVNADITNATVIDLTGQTTPVTTVAELATMVGTKVANTVQIAVVYNGGTNVVSMIYVTNAGTAAS